MFKFAGVNKDPTVWLVGARPPPMYVFKNYMSLTNSKIWPTKIFKIWQAKCLKFIIKMRFFEFLLSAWLCPVRWKGIDIERKNRLLKVCYVTTTSAAFLASYLLQPLTVLMRQTKQPVRAINQSIFLRCLCGKVTPRTNIS